MVSVPDQTHGYPYVSESVVVHPRDGSGPITTVSIGDDPEPASRLRGSRRSFCPSGAAMGEQDTPASAIEKTRSRSRPMAYDEYDVWRRRRHRSWQRCSVAMMQMRLMIRFESRPWTLRLMLTDASFYVNWCPCISESCWAVFLGQQTNEKEKKSSVGVATGQLRHKCLSGVLQSSMQRISEGCNICLQCDLNHASIQWDSGHG